MRGESNPGTPSNGRSLNFLRSSAREINELRKNIIGGLTGGSSSSTRDLRATDRDQRDRELLPKEKEVIPISSSPPSHSSPVIGRYYDPDAFCSGWMKMRHPVKFWVSRWFVLKQGVLVWYRDEKVASQPKRKPSGAIMLGDTDIREHRISKDGMFSLKIESNNNRSIYKTKPGLKIAPSLRWNPSYAVLRVSSENARKLWIQQIGPQIEWATSHKNAIHLNISHDEESDYEDESDEGGLPTSPKLSRRDVHHPSSLGQHVVSAANANISHSGHLTPTTASTLHEDGAFVIQPITVDRGLSFESLPEPMPIINQEPGQRHNRVFFSNLNELQRREAFEQQDRTMHALEQWKNDLSTKMNSVEGRITRSVDSGVKKVSPISLGAFHLMLMILFVMMLGRLSKRMVGDIEDL
ncbi:hypothetical protein PROFUN_04745 [Planoprotostelium fungivorum]|uniref:PH domain-containing protein n=1 Tax=Planoprotostelium fungivorum TaxID=1890364 RepID=A0A2P6NG31_9EUKA|nr:hypothetical protein PROFUN_04745 [Planoprotostelium fungivorum]